MAALNESTPTILGTFYGGNIFRFTVTNTGALPLTAVIMEGQATPESPWVTLIDANVDVTNLTNILGYTISDESDDLMHLKPGATGAVHIACATYTSIRVSATGPDGSTATAAQARPLGFPPDLTSDLNQPGGAGLVGTIPGHGLDSTDVQGTLYELADDTAALVGTVGAIGATVVDHETRIDALEAEGEYVLPVAGAALGGVKSGGNVTIDGTGQMTAPTYTLPIASAGALGGVRVGSGLSIDGDGILSAAGGGAVDSVNGQTGVVVLNTSHITEDTNLYYTDARVRATVLTGVSFGTGTAVVATDTLLVGVGKLQKQITDLIAVDATKASLSGSETLTNKRITPRTDSVASGATLTPIGDSIEYMLCLALAAGTTIAAPTGTPTQGQKLIIRLKDNGTARSIAWNAIYRASTDLALPSTTVVNKTLYLGFIYNATDSKWDFVAFLNNI